MDLPLPIGRAAYRPEPLGRFLPPLEPGVASSILDAHGAFEGVLLDPFGASPQLALEAAKAGARVLIAANNPVNRFLLIHRLQPFSVDVLRAALARLAAAPKDSTRLEPFLLDLYSTHCAHCGSRVIAEYFVWDRELGGPALKAYHCDHCNQTGEFPVTEEDWQRAQDFSRKGLQHALALEAVAPAGDPDRKHAEAALAVYPGRALFGLVTLVNKLAQIPFPPQERLAVEALMLSALDAANALWGHPEGRVRPRQLVASPRFLERNIWRALEQAVSDWSAAEAGVDWETWPSSSGIRPGRPAIFAGTLRALADTLEPQAIGLLLTVPPRPNQAYWTLSALWTAWLWGREAAAPIKTALRRKRYDWAWHASAMRTVLQALNAKMAQGTVAYAYLPEAEPGFNAAVLAAFDGAGFRLTGRALRVAEGQAFLRWRREVKAASGVVGGGLAPRMQEAAERSLLDRGEPAPYDVPHAAAWSGLAADRALAGLWQEQDRHPLAHVGEALEAILADRRLLLHFAKGEDPESGLYWLEDETRASEPLADRAELCVLQYLRSVRTSTEREVDRGVCAALKGLMTPDRRWVRACLNSYAEHDPEEDAWRLRQEDTAESRERDLAEMRELLAKVGAALGYQVQSSPELRWLDEESEVAFVFHVIETACLGPAIRSHPSPSAIWVLPGGRAGLVAEKARRDPRLRQWLDSGMRVLKFRHVRRLAEEPTLTRESLFERMKIDPPEHQDPQLPLL